VGVHLYTHTVDGDFPMSEHVPHDVCIATYLTDIRHVYVLVMCNVENLWHCLGEQGAAEAVQSEGSRSYAQRSPHFGGQARLVFHSRTSR
jgi:hypothetical protein